MGSQSANHPGIWALLLCLVPVYASCSSVDFVGADLLWTNGFDGNGAVVGQVDDAVDNSHPALRNVINYDFSGTGLTPNAHATRTAGIFCSTDSTCRGVAPGCTLLAGKALTRSDTVAAFTGLYDLGARVFNMSYTFNDLPNNGFNQLALFADWFTRENDVLMVKSAGNAYDITSPGDAFNVLTIGRTTEDYSMVYTTSGSGLLSDGRSKPDLVAPGTNITTTYPGGLFTEASGTSYSAPHVTGAAALLLQMGDELDLSTNHNVLKSVLMTSADKSVLDKNGDTWSADYGVLDEHSGAGQLDVATAAMIYESGTYSPGTVAMRGWAEDSVDTTELEDVFMLNDGIDVLAGSTLTMTLNWDRIVDWLDDGDGVVEYTDTFLPSALENLDLYLVDHATGSTVASSQSLVDNVEHVWFTFEETGQYDIMVAGIDLTSEVQYALSWNLQVVPEPSMIAMAIALGIAVFIRKRRNYPYIIRGERR